MSRSSKTTHTVRFLLGVSHTSPHVGVDGELQRLDEEATVEGNTLNIDCLGCIVDSGLSRLGVTCNDSLVVCFQVSPEAMGSDKPSGTSLKRTRPFLMRPMMR
jgi:hypothetical protein